MGDFSTRRPDLLPHQGDGDESLMGRHLQEIEQAFGHGQRLSYGVGGSTRLDLSQDLVGSSEVSIRGNQKAAQGMMRATHILKADPGLQAPESLVQVEEHLLVDDPPDGVN